MAVETFEKGARAIPDTDEVLGQVARMKSMITDAVDEGVQSAMSAIRQGRRVAQDALDDATDAVTTNPLRSVGVVLAAGIAIGAIAVWLSGRRT